MGGFGKLEQGQVKKKLGVGASAASNRRKIGIAGARRVRSLEARAGGERRAQKGRLPF